MILGFDSERESSFAEVRREKFVVFLRNRSGGASGDGGRRDAANRNRADPPIDRFVRLASLANPRRSVGRSVACFPSPVREIIERMR